MKTTAKANQPDTPAKMPPLKPVEKKPAPNADVAISREKLREIESLAIELAGIAGAEITKAVGGLLAVRYKTGAKEDQWKDPVSDVDQKVERIIRERLAENFPKHDIIGEESTDRPAKSDFIWSVDPIDGT
ncbi:MAG: inositol monophosphatase family protein, partial [Pseudolabrys sp.]|nr:inositol monophosphatase family protein [Pseudolabrys sp.]